MTTKILSAVAAAGLLGAGVAWAADSSAQPAAPQEPAAVAPAQAHHWQGARNMRRPAFRRMALRRLARRLNLDQNQKVALRHLHAKTMAQVWAIRANDTLPADQRHNQVKAAFESSRAELRNVLTPAQRATLDQIESRPERTLLGL